MKILVLDDNQLNRQAAEVQLKGHDLKVVGTYAEAESMLEDEFGLIGTFDVVLTDLMVPAPNYRVLNNDIGGKFVGQEMPLGSILALLAIAKGVKKVAVVTDMNHHHHPASAALDGFPEIAIGDTKVLCLNGCVVDTVDADTFERLNSDFLFSDEGREKYPDMKGALWVKTWDRVLKMLCD